MRPIGIVILFSIFSLNIYGQFDENQPNLNENLKFQTTVGTYFTNNSMFGSYISPSLNYKFNLRLNISAGVLVNSVNFNNVYDNEMSYKQLKAVQTYYYAQAQYQMNEKLILTGDIIYGNNNFLDEKYTKYNSPNYSYSFGAIYKISNSLEFQFQIRQTSGNNSYNRYNPYYSSNGFYR